MPTLQNLKGDITILCLSTGNYYNQGKLRKKEMKKVCVLMQINLYITESFLDNSDWNIKDISNTINFLHIQYNYTAIYTFDKKGVSLHKNHTACYLGVLEFIKKNNVVAYSLITKSIFKKYFIDFGSKFDERYIVNDFYKGIKIMKMHESQMEWFRYLYILFSKYMRYNDYKRIVLRF
ncbi:N-acetylglucosaminyl-phosphatidylinositol de-N-acetylase [Gurleya vavrai]